MDQKYFISINFNLQRFIQRLFCAKPVKLVKPIVQHLSPFLLHGPNLGKPIEFALKFSETKFNTTIVR